MISSGAKAYLRAAFFVGIIKGWQVIQWVSMR